MVPLALRYLSHGISYDESLASLTATIDNPSAAYVAAGTGLAEFVVQPIGTPAPGATVTVNVTITGKNLRGDDITPLNLDFDIQGPPPPPPATHVIVAGATEGQGATSLPNPGTPSVSLRVS